MTKRAAEEEVPPSIESRKTGPDFFANYKAQVAELLSQEERIPHHERSSNEIIGAEISNLRKDKLNALLRKSVCDLIPEVDEMQMRVHSVLKMSQLKTKKPSTSPNNAESVISEDPTFTEAEEDMQSLMRSDPSLFKEVMSRHSDVLFSRLNNMQQQLEKLLDNVLTTCRPMSRGERRDLQKSIKELTGENLKHVARIIKNHYMASGKEFPDEITVNLEEEDKTLLWRLHYYVGTVKQARKLAS